MLYLLNGCVGFEKKDGRRETEGGRWKTEDGRDRHSELVSESIFISKDAAMNSA